MTIGEIIFSVVAVGLLIIWGVLRHKARRNN
jgi:hypothetical protein